MTKPKEPLTRLTLFKSHETDGTARASIEGDAETTREKIARLRALRLEQEAPEEKPAKPRKGRKAPK